MAPPGNWGEDREGNVGAMKRGKQKDQRNAETRRDYAPPFLAEAQSPAFVGLAVQADEAATSAPASDTCNKTRPSS